MNLILILFNIAVPRFKKIQKLVDQLNLVTREFLPSDGDQGCSTPSCTKKSVSMAQPEPDENQLVCQPAEALTMPLMMLIMNAISILIAGSARARSTWVRCRSATSWPHPVYDADHHELSDAVDGLHQLPRPACLPSASPRSCRLNRHCRSGRSGPFTPARGHRHIRARLVRYPNADGRCAA